MKRRKFFSLFWADNRRNKFQFLRSIFPLIIIHRTHSHISLILICEALFSHERKFCHVLRYWLNFFIHYNHHRSCDLVDWIEIKKSEKFMTMLLPCSAASQLILMHIKYQWNLFSVDKRKFSWHIFEDGF
jgi:hypothetical protein